VPRAEGRAPGIGRLRRWVGRGRRGGGCVPRQAALELGQEGTMDRPPQPIGADVVEPLGQPMRQTATDALLGGQGHGLPPLVLGVLVAEAHLPSSAGEAVVVGQRDPGDSPGLGPSGLAPCLARSVDRRRPTLWSRPLREGAGRGVPDAPARAPARERAARGHGRALRRTGGRAATRSGRRRPHWLAPDRAQVDDRRGAGSRGGGRRGRQ
jgi:hypothetical protein